MIIATTKEYLDYVLDHLPACGTVRYRKMFGEYMIYIDDKPLLTVCDNTVFVIREKAVRSGTAGQRPVHRLPL